MLRLKRILNIIRPFFSPFLLISKNVTVMNEINHFASVSFRHCGKSKHFALDLRIFGSKTECSDFPQCPQITDMQFLASKHACITFLEYCSHTPMSSLKSKVNFKTILLWVG